MADLSLIRLMRMSPPRYFLISRARLLDARGADVITRDERAHYACARRLVTRDIFADFGSAPVDGIAARRGRQDERDFPGG